MTTRGRKALLAVWNAVIWIALALFFRWGFDSDAGLILAAAVGAQVNWHRVMGHEKERNHVR